MKYCRKSVLLLGIFVNLLLPMGADATIEFYLLPNDVKQKISCDFLELKGNQALCTANNLLITFDLSRMKTIEVVDKGIASNFLLFTEETRNTIHELNSDKRNNNEDKPKVNEKQTNLDFSNFIKKFVTYFKYEENRSVASIVLLITGLVVFLIGNIGFLIAAFRAGVFWGLSTMFLPLVSFVFLFVHWKTAARPFLVILSGVAVVLLGIFFTPTNQHAQNISPLASATILGKVRKKDSNFQCNGKIYCSEMSSCAEARFYLRNCSGTKMDGNNDGIPCEKQWCGH